MIKKETPLRLLEIVEPFIKENSNFLIASSDDECFYIIKDKDLKSNFYLKIFPKAPEGVVVNKADFYVEKSPQSIVTLGSHIIPVVYNDLNNILLEWAMIILKYNSIESVLDDPILKAYQQEFYEEYIIVDEDAEYAPFKSQQLLFLDEYLGVLESNLDKYKDGLNDKEIDEIKIDSKDLRKELTRLSKKKVMNKLTLIWAKMQKQGLKLIKEFVKEGKKEFFKFILKRAIETITSTDPPLIS